MKLIMLDNFLSFRSRLFKGWITLSIGLSALSIGYCKLFFFFNIYQVDSVNHPLKNWALFIDLFFLVYYLVSLQYVSAAFFFFLYLVICPAQVPAACSFVCQKRKVLIHKPRCTPYRFSTLLNLLRVFSDK